MADIEFPEDVEDGIIIETFLQKCATRSSLVYFHNLKFDGHFIIDWLMKKGFKHQADKNAKLKERHFKTLISSMNKFYSITVKWSSGKQTEFRDSLKKLPFGIARIAESFKLEQAKGTLDYHTYRAVGHKLTPEERKYLHDDVSILAYALGEVWRSGMKKLTVGADALYEYKEMQGKQFDRTFPVLPQELDEEIRRAYRGGFTYASPRFKGKRQGRGLVLDVNSLYPYIMRTRVLPHDVPVFVPGEVKPTERFPLYIQNVTFTARLKKNHIPVIQLKNHFAFAPTDYISNIDEPVSMTLTNVDWELFNDHYDIQVLEWGGGYLFRGHAGFFDTYIDKWSKVKENSTGGLREIAKLHLNSLYGKFATNPNVTGKVPELTEEGAVKYVLGEPEERPPVYTAMGAFITAYARDLTVRAAQANYDVFAYADTDSLHLLTDELPEGIEIDPNKLGAWKLEYRFTEAFYVRSKVYMELKESGEYATAFAGLPEATTKGLTFDDLTPGKVLKGKLSPKSVPGGIVLSEVDFTLNM